ncbi:hypothetical protein [Viridibacillus arvi]|uniref:hypothetical protein n=1 Tax=Viridibacillus arvi TaxID=263475 RepID=UPI0034CEA52F
MTFTLICDNNTVAKDDDIQYLIEDDGGNDYLSRLLMVIKDEHNNAIGELTGYILHADSILSDEANSFLIMDGISQLLCNAHELITANKNDFSGKESVLFLNRLSLYEGHFNNELERNVISFLTSNYQAVIYSLGDTELTDNDFLEIQDRAYFEYWGKELKKNNWKYTLDLDLYYKN